MFDPKTHRFVEVGHQEEFGIQSLVWSSWTYQLVGLPERAHAGVEHGIELAHRLGHPYTLCFCRAIAAWGYVLGKDRHRARGHANDGIQVGVEQGFPLLDGATGIVAAWADGLEGEASDVLEPFAAAMNLASSAGNQVGVPMILCALAELQLAAGEAEAALGTADGALAFAQQTEQNFCDAELHRLKAEILLRGTEDASADAEILLRRAIEIARGQGARFLELQAALSLARLRQRQGRPAEARAIIAPVYEGFTEGLDMEALMGAKALLEDLS